MKTMMLKAGEIKKEWLVIDAQDVVLGRLASAIALILKGKHKPAYTPNLDCGDNVIVINAAKIALTGKKAENSKWYYHTGYPGGVKERTKGQILAKKPEKLVELAVKRMLDAEPLGRKILGNLKVYPGADHPHAAQNPKPYDFASKNRKNRVTKRSA